MATNEALDDEGERCVTAFEAVSEVALEHCEGREAIVRFVSSYVGIEPDDVDAEATSGSVNRGTCESIRDSREWVLHRTVDLIDEEGVAPPDAVQQAWTELTDECDDLGVNV